MISRAFTVTFVGALLAGAAIGCGDGGAGGGGAGGAPYGGGAYGAGGPASATGSSSGGATSSSSGATASSSGATGSSSGASGSSGSGSGSGSSSGGVDAGPPVEAGPPPLTVATALQQIGQCMSYTAFTSRSPYGVAAADVAQCQTNQNQPCMACHQGDANNFFAEYGTQNGQNLTQVMFQTTQTQPWIMAWFSTTTNTDGSFKDVVPSNAIATQSMLSMQPQCQQGAACHPMFKLSTNQMDAINAFVSETINNWHAGTCSSDAGAPDAGAD